MQMLSSPAAAPSKALLLFSGSTKQVYLLFVCSASLLFNDAILIFERLFA